MRAQPNPGGEAPSTATSGLHILAGLRIAIGDLVALEAGVVGEWAPPSGGPSHAFVYADGVMADLNNLIPGGSGWDLASAKLINDAGQIAGQGVLAGEYPAFLLTPLTPTRDHYKCYRTRSLSHFAPRSVPLVDEFGTSDSSVLRPAHLCNPADEDGGGISDPTAHLMCYAIRDAAPFTRRSVLVRNQFGDQTLMVARPQSLCPACGQERRAAGV